MQLAQGSNRRSHSHIRRPQQPLRSMNRVDELEWMEEFRAEGHAAARVLRDSIKGCLASHLQVWTEDACERREVKSFSGYWEE